ncbi:RagB/SusD family nutrient uptake outer membrane protein [Reichenbachiella versicolor]|uniref:RagB/SusD family nutrient uptake outer membrane protein n=1 Tax=Reichenbachiella versicolor TaxID=1821036 RepID=UPI000D6E34D9|nr:RagB/SusD family nutrient uptake outer membrane protein [Reichenbachiella versicolor]
MKSKLYSIIMIILAATIVACEEYLDQENPNRVTQDSFWSNLDETDRTVTSVYNAMLNHYVTAGQWENHRSDLTSPLNNRNGNAVNANNELWYSHTYNASTRQISNRWQAWYTVIQRANQAISGLENLPDEVKELNTVEWNSQMGQAVFFRGLMHFYLHSNFNNGRIIIRDNNILGEEFNSSLSSSEEVLAFFRNDFKRAYDLLPFEYAEAGKSVGRVRKGAAALLLAKSYLYENQYDSAITVLEDLIDRKAEFGFDLLTGDDRLYVYGTTGEHNVESILEITYELEGEELLRFHEAASHNRWARFHSPGANRNNNSISFPFGGGSGEVTMSAWLAYAYKNEEVDAVTYGNRIVSLRAQAMAALPMDTFPGYYGQPIVANAASFNTRTVGYFRKYSNWDVLENELDNVRGENWYSDKNVVLYRFADAYLMLAECYAQTGDAQKALDLINVIRSRWELVLRGTDVSGTGGTYDGEAYTPEMVMDTIMYHERPLEIGLDGVFERVNDLRRWGVAGERYQALSEEDWWVEDLQTAYPTITAFPDLTGCVIMKGTAPVDATKNVVEKEFQDAALKFASEPYGYFPIPETELETNTSL